MLCRSWWLLILLFIVSPAFAADLEQELQQLCSDPLTSQLCEPKSRFMAHEPNHIISRAAVDDESSLEAHYSLKYLLNSNDCLTDFKHDLLDPKSRKECIDGYPVRKEVYFSYTGRFDFYYGSRDSGPVVNRISNPAFHLRQYLPTTCEYQAGNRVLDFMTHKLVRDSWAIRFIDLGLEHRSNGQTVDAGDTVTDTASPDFGRYLTEIAYANNDHAYFDSLSRSSSYISIAAQFNLGSNSDSTSCSEADNCAELQFSVKPVYISDEAAITWGPLAGSDTEFADYDRYKLQLRDTFYFRKIPLLKDISPSTRLQYGLDWSFGDRFFATDSFDFSLTVPLGAWDVPLYFRWHHGPLQTLSNYTKDQDTYGVGLEFR